MKTNFRNFIVIAVLAAAIVSVSSCNKQTCPTYSKGEVKTTENKA
jgi:hypothetical protein